MMTNESLSIGKQIALLIEHGCDIHGQQYSLADVARLTGIRYQTLANLIDESSSNSRLKTLRTLCRLYGISLDYFACETEAACLSTLQQHQLTHAPDKIRKIDSETQKLSAKGKRNVLAMMEWIRAASHDG